MATRQEALSLSSFILSEYQDRVQFRSYTGKTLSNSCEILSEIVPEFQLTPVIILGTGNYTDKNPLLNKCHPALENTKRTFILYNQEFPVISEKNKGIFLSEEHPLLADWFFIVYAPEIAYLLLIKTNAELEAAEIPVLVSYDREIIKNSLIWLTSKLSEIDQEKLINNLSEIDKIIVTPLQREACLVRV
ncbi:MAG: hypothetical protein FD167_1446 [bacterium]|nr:MAG: hypothetical protein FD167_1446 [bacterium]